METSLVDQRLDEIARLLAVLCRRLGPDGESLQDFVVELAKAGLPPARIAELADTSANYVGVALARDRKKRR